MVKTQAEDTAIEALRALLKKWGSVLALCGGACGLFYEHKRGLEKLTDALAQLRKDCDARDQRDTDIRRFGSDGFHHPEIRAAMDGTIRSFLSSYTSQAERDLKQWQRRLCELNPQIRCPGE